MSVNQVYPFYFTLGALILYLLFFLVPGMMGFYYSFTDWSSYSTDVNFVGMDNFYRIFFETSAHYIDYIKNTVTFTVVTIILKTVIALFLALLLTSGVKRLANFHRAVIFLPVVLPLLVVGLVFKSILHPTTGILNVFLRTVGLGFFAQKWLVDVDWALLSVIGVDTWKGVGYLMVILIAGLHAIPNDYYEAARIDGANAMQMLWHITIPLLTPSIMVVTVLNLLYGLKVFDIVWVLTNGGPGYATETVYTAVFREFSKGRYGIATALSTMLFVIMVSFGYFVIRLMHKEEVAI